MCEKYLEEELQPIMQESLERYIGSYVPEIGVDWDIILNEIYPIIQTEIPSIFFRVPRAYLKPRNKFYITKKRNPLSGEKEEVQIDASKSAQTQEALLNYDVSQMKYKEESRRVAIDALMFPYGVLWHGYKGDFGMTEEQSIFIRDEKVFVKRISPLKFGWDISVNLSNYDEGEFVYRCMNVPLKDIIEDDKLNVDKKLKGFTGFGQKAGLKSLIEKMKSSNTYQGRDSLTRDKITTSLIDYADKNFKDKEGSKFVKVYEVFLRPTKKEKRDGKNGTILLLTTEQDKPLRESEWTIKAEGFPGRILQFNELNDCMFGIADVDTYKQIADQKNAVINQQLANAQEVGKTWVGVSKEGADEEDIKRIVSGQNSIVLFESGNPRDRMFVSSGAGQGSSELYTLDQRIQQNLDNASGVNDLKRGVLRSGEESAFSVRQRAMGSNLRPSYRQDIMTDFLKDSFLYINQLHKQFMPFKEAVRITGSLDIEWSENPSKEEIQADVDVEIEAISMLPENPEDEIMKLQQTLQLMVQGLSDPIVSQKIMQEGKTINISPLIEQLLMRQKIRNPDIFRSIRPEESQGFVSVQQLREAESNIQAIAVNQQLPFPPKETDDHRVKLEVYNSIRNLMATQGQINQRLDELIMIQGQMMQMILDKQGGDNKPVKFPTPKLEQV